MFYRYNPYAEYNSSTPPRPLRIIFGFLLAAAGLTGGIGHAVHDHHRALVMQAEPQQITWQELVENGYGDNPHIQLVDVEIIDPYAEIGEWFEDEMEEFMDDPFMRAQMAKIDIGPAIVIPRGKAVDSEEQRVQIATGVSYLDQAFLENDENGTLTGMVSTYTSDHMIKDVYAFCTGTPIEELIDESEEPVYTIVPSGDRPDVSIARNAFLGLGFALSLGLVWLGSGGPGMWCCWYAPLPSALSMIGYPMRYGRGSWGTRIVYIGIGSVLIGYGFYMMHGLGKLGEAEGNPIFHALGFAALFTGLGAVLAVPIQITTRALSASVECTPKKKEVRMSWEQACSMEPVVTEKEYVDEPLAKIDLLPLSGKLKENADKLAEKGFTAAESMQWQRESGLAAATVQLGCQRMVISDMEYNNESDIIESAMISVLGTGFPVITVSANSGFKQNRPTPGAIIRRASQSDPTEMLGGHLEVVINEAEERDTVVVEFHASESNDIVQFARRVLAEAQGTMDGQIIKVGPKRYGRFNFPTTPVPEFTGPTA